MSFEIFIMGDYSLFVWTAFIFTLTTCYVLYVKTKKEFQKQRKIYFKEFEEKQINETKTDKEKKETLSARPVF